MALTSVFSITGSGKIAGKEGNIFRQEEPDIALHNNVTVFLLIEKFKLAEKEPVNSVSLSKASDINIVLLSFSCIAVLIS